MENFPPVQTGGNQNISQEKTNVQIFFPTQFLFRFPVVFFKQKNFQCV